MSSFSLFAQTTDLRIQQYFTEKYRQNPSLLSDYFSYQVSDSYTEDATGITHIYLQQHYKKIPIYNGINVLAIKNNTVVSENSRFMTMLRKKINATTPAITAMDALMFTLQHLEIADRGTYHILKSDADRQIYVYENNDIATSPIKVQLYYTIVDSTLKLSWDVSFEIKGQSHWWNTRIDAINGKYLEKNDYVTTCAFDHEHDNDMPAPPPPPPASPTTSYRVFALPTEAPNFGSRVLLTDPSDSIASPYTWLDTNGVTGNEFNITRGNNVFAYEDANNDNLPGYSPSALTLVYDFPFANNVTPITNQDAALTNLFYVNNKVHDMLYAAGFTELAGNFQANNYGRGGIAKDEVRAEGFDGSGTNNANFATPPDGSQPRMQMYLWTGNGAICSNLNVSAAPYISGNLTIGTAAFAVNASATDTVVLAIDGTAPINDGCTPMTNVSGKIALIDRGTCTFGNKALNAQNSGAVGVIIVNNIAGAPPALGGTAPGLTIPVLSISQADGNAIKTALTNGTTVTATMNTCVPNQLDANFDNGIIAHEYGHGVSNRLTGGPSQASCLSNAEQGGEGWSDWIALIATMKVGDSANQARGVGTYAIGQPSTGVGIRRYPYSYNMSINPLTYTDVAANTEVHAIGEIWCAAVWDMTWNLVNTLGFDPNLGNTTSGNYIALKLVLEGMKLQPCNPGFIDARNAILQADALLYNNAHRCLIWSAFARRGMGYTASQGSATSASDQTADFSLPYFCLPPTAVPTAAFNSNITSVACGATVNFNDLSTQAFDWKWYFGDGDTSLLQNPSHTYSSPGTYTVKLVVTNPLGNDSQVSVNYINVAQAFSNTLSLNKDTICLGDSVRVVSQPTGSLNYVYTVEPITFAPTTITGTTVTLTDDSYSAALPIGFSFNFYGNTYSQFYICSNGFITFTAGQPTSVVYGPSLPSASQPNNLIAVAWNDWNPQNAGSVIRYETVGTSPNRKLIVSYSTSHYGGTIYPLVAQVVLCETSNIIEIHTTTLSDITPYDNTATTTQGVENSSGSKATTIPGRNSALFGTTNDAYRFTQTVLYNHTWMPTNNNNDTVLFTPTTATTFTVNVSDGMCTQSYVSSMVEIDNPTVNASYNQPVYTNDTLKLQMSSPQQINSYAWSGPAAVTGNTQNLNVPNINSVAHSGIYTYSVVDAFGCTQSNTMSVTVTAAPMLRLKAFLGNAYSSVTGLMFDSLRTKNLIPLTEPYSATPYNNAFVHVNGGGEQTSNSVLATSGNNAPVDWVFVQLRDKNDSSIVLATKAALIQRDGDVVDARNGTEPLVFTTLGLDNYFVSIKHRNHLGMMSAAPITLSENSSVLDFTNLATAMYTRPAPLNNPSPFSGAGRIVGSTRVLYGGNVNIDVVSGAARNVRYNGFGNDRITVLTLTGINSIMTGYYREDVNMDGAARYNGFNNDRLQILQLMNSNTNSTINEQTPN